MIEVAVAFVVLFLLLFLEVPIAFGMGLVGFLGLIHFLDVHAGFRWSATRPSDRS